jgi:NADPH:quinone reductase-like Zn-dependent oxidoreductase
MALSCSTAFERDIDCRKVSRLGNLPGANEVLVAIEYSPLNPNDLLVARGA